MTQRFGATYHLHLQGKKSTKQETSVLVGGKAEGRRQLRIEEP
jgi:hypothetical protein